MFDLIRLHTAPLNITDYVGEILPGFRELYGPDAAEYYALAASSAISTAIGRPEVLAFGCKSGSVVSAILLAKQDNTRTTISFLHVLEPYRSLGTGDALLAFALDSLETHGEIFTEFVPFHPMDLGPVFERFGFKKIERQLMRSPTGTIAPAYPSGFEFTHPSLSDLGALAAVLTETYVGHQERFLFPEVHSELKALDYLSRASAGHFGQHQPDYTVAVWKDGQCAGFGVGCQVLPGLGFVLHLAVWPAFQRRGIGTGLLLALSAAFAREGLDYIALGVTCDNPAVKLYNRAGFREKTRIPVYYRLAGAFEGVSPSDHR